MSKPQKIISVLAGSFIFLYSLTAGAGVWQQFHSGCDHVGAWDGSIILEALTSPKWVAGSNLKRSTQPCISADGSTIFAYASGSGNSGTITAFNAFTGVEKWSTTVTSYESYGSWSSPVYDNGYVYWAGSDGSAGKTYKINATNGSTAAPDGGWKVSITGEIVNASPTIANNRLYISTYGGFSPENGSHFALNLSDGSISWSNNDGGQGQGAMAYDVGRNRIYQTMYEGDKHYLRSYDADNGNTDWTANWAMGAGAYGAPFQCAIAYKDNKIYVQDYNFYGDGLVHVANATNNGAELWNASTPVSGDSCPAIDPDGNVYAYGDYQSNGQTRAYDENGNILWTFSEGGGWQACPAWADGYVFVGDQTANNLYLLDDATGTAVWSGAGSGPVAFGNDYFYTIGYDGQLYGYSTIPEPGTLIMLLSGLSGLICWKRLSRAGKN